MPGDDILIIDAHLDLAMNAIEWNRDLTKTVATLRAEEAHLNDKLDRGKNTVALPELKKGKIGLVVATQIARYIEPGSELPGYRSPEIAWGITQAQLAWYRCMEEQGQMTPITDLATLEKHLALWVDDQDINDKPVGYILSLEGADSLVNISYLEKAYAYGLRACGPAHYGPGRYACGTGKTEGFTARGFELLKEMDNLHMILDATHLTDKGFDEAMERYQGPVWASHHNCRAIIHHQRQLTDDQIKVLIDRNAVIGGVLDTWMLENNWQRGIDSPEKKQVRLERVVDHFDRICQIAGNANHIGIGSDLDGGYGKEQSPCDLDTIADLQQLRNILSSRGYSGNDINNIFHGNWLRFLRKAWK